MRDWLVGGRRRGAGRESGRGWMCRLTTDLVSPGAQCPGVLRECGEKHDCRLVVNAPRRQPLAVEGTLQLGVEAFCVLPHAVEPAVALGSGRSHTEVLGAVETVSRVDSGGKKRLPPIVVRTL